jgi:3-methyl-2-oxobutanoate hydroxymethyltransferase
MDEKKVTILDVQQAKKEGRKLAMVTAYDYPIGLLAAEAGEEMVSNLV